MYSISPNITEKISIDETLIVTAEEAGKWLGLSPSAITMQTDMLESLIKTTTEMVENYSWITLRQTEYEAYYDLQSTSLLNLLSGKLKLSLERSPIIDITDITKIEYLESDNWIEFNRGAMTVDGLYENTTEKQERLQWASVYFRDSVSFQQRVNAYKIRITFTSGYDPLETDPTKKIPESIKTAIKMIVASMYTNRGDCDSSCRMNGYPVPCSAKAMIDLISPSNVMLGGSYTPAPDFYCLGGEDAN
jgi:hypothetical protein